MNESATEEIGLSNRIKYFENCFKQQKPIKGARKTASLNSLSEFEDEATKIPRKVLATCEINKSPLWNKEMIDLDEDVIPKVTNLLNNERIVLESKTTKIPSLDNERIKDITTNYSSNFNFESKATSLNNLCKCDDGDVTPKTAKIPLFTTENPFSSGNSEAWGSTITRDSDQCRIPNLTKPDDEDVTSKILLFTIGKQVSGPKTKGVTPKILTHSKDKDVTARNVKNPTHEQNRPSDIRKDPTRLSPQNSEDFRKLHSLPRFGSERIKDVGDISDQSSASERIKRVSEINDQGFVSVRMKTANFSASDRIRNGSEIGDLGRIEVAARYNYSNPFANEDCYNYVESFADEDRFLEEFESDVYFDDELRTELLLELERSDARAAMKMYTDAVLTKSESKELSEGRAETKIKIRRLITFVRNVCMSAMKFAVITGTGVIWGFVKFALVYSVFVYCICHVLC